MEGRYNSEHGQPGPLAYKVDTLIINRRIEEAPRPIPRLIKLGSLNDICRELGISQGKNIVSVKKALHQNAVPISRPGSNTGRWTAPSGRWKRVSPAIAWSSPARSYQTAARPTRFISFSVIFTCRSSTGR